MATHSPPPLSPGSEPTRHYDTVVDAWSHLLGEDLHYGYFEQGNEPLTAATDALTDQMLHLARLSPGSRVLDVGCGTGKAACRMAIEHGCEVIGISPSRRCVEEAAARASRERTQVVFCQGDGTAMTFADDSFDCLWVMESSHLMDDKSALLDECCRTLSDGGRLVLCDIMLPRKLSLEEVIDYRDEFLLQRDVFGRAKMATLEFYREEITRRGLVIDDARWISEQTRPTFSRWRDNAAASKAAVIELLGATAWQQFASASEVLEQFWDENILGYGILGAHKPGI
jgi:27-O-demethylrifamycin SV methyltransferase